jgi:hypothetical protein
MKYNLLIKTGILSVSIFVGCGILMVKKYTPEIKLVNVGIDYPPEYYDTTGRTLSNELSFKDSNVTVNFIYYEKSLGFSIKNNSKKMLRVNWDNCLFQLLTPQRIIHVGTKYIDKANPQTPSVIPPFSTIVDNVTPAENIYFITGQYGGWQVTNLLPLSTSDTTKYNPMMLLGRDIIFYLAIETDKEKYNYAFRFRITNMALKQ